MKQKNVQQLSACKSKERGGTLVLVAVFMVALFGFAALSVDVGNVLVQKTRLQEAGDSASMASVVDWADGATADTTAQRARNFASLNGVPTNEVKTVRVGRWDQTTRTFVAKDPLGATDIPAVEVTNQRVVPMYFARVVGFPSMNPRTVSVAAVAAASGATGVIPFGVCDVSGSIAQSRCSPVTFKVDSGGTGTNVCSLGAGNFGALDLGGNSGQDFTGYIQDGFPGTIHIGCTYDSLPGNKTGPIKKTLDDRLKGVPAYTCTVSPPSPAPENPRLAILPKVETLDVSGKKTVCITGFYVVVIDNIINAKGGEVQVQARFLNTYDGSEIDPSKKCQAGELCGVSLVK
jgi:Flp pilus assembly protein TadG